MTSHVTGLGSFLRGVGKARAKDGQRVEDALRRCAEVILKKSQPLVPVETGALKASGHVVVDGKGLGAKAAVLYGGPDAPYALYVHEDMTKYHAPPTGAKFLEKAVRSSRGVCASILKREMEARPVKVVDGEEV